MQDTPTNETLRGSTDAWTLMMSARRLSVDDRKFDKSADTDPETPTRTRKSSGAQRLASNVQRSTLESPLILSHGRQLVYAYGMVEVAMLNSTYRG